MIPFSDFRLAIKLETCVYSYNKLLNSKEMNQLLLHTTHDNTAESHRHVESKKPEREKFMAYAPT